MNGASCHIYSTVPMDCPLCGIAVRPGVSHRCSRPEDLPKPDCQCGHSYEAHGKTSGVMAGCAAMVPHGKMMRRGCRCNGYKLAVASPAPAAPEEAPQRAHGESARDPKRGGAEKLHGEEIGGSGGKD